MSILAAYFGYFAGKKRSWKYGIIFIFVLGFHTWYIIKY